MKSLQNILVIAEDIGPNQAVLDKALRFALNAKASITIIANKENKELSQYLELIYQQHSANSSLKGSEMPAKLSFDINIKYYSAPFSHKEILTEIASHNYDLLIRDIHAAKLKWGFTWSDNRYLLREANTNLLLVGNKQWPESGHILTALETEEVTGKHQKINQFMLNESRYLAQLLDSDVHLINCYQEQPNISLATNSMTESVEEPSDIHRQHLQDSALAFGIRPEHIHVEPGLPEYVIPHEAEKYKIDIVVLCSGEHQGLLGIIKGHTSYYMVDTLSCDALILKASICTD